MTAKRLARSLISRAVQPLGYAVSGNHIFTQADYQAIAAGRFRLSVSENPARHAAKVQRAARILGRIYT